MRSFIIAACAVISYILQTTLLQRFQIIGITVHASFVFICIVAIYSDFYFGILITLFLGMTQDVLFSPWLGLHTIIFVIIYLCLYYLFREEKKIQFWKMIFSIIGATVLMHILYMAFLFFVGHPLRGMDVLAKMILGEVLGNVLISIPIIFLFRHLYREQESRYISGI